jgi:hypothetical protein
MRIAIRLRILILGVSLVVFSCIRDEFVDDFIMPQIEISNPIDSLKIDDSYQYEYRYLNNIGAIDSTIEVNWLSLSPMLLTITNDGLATAISEGMSQIVLSSLTNPQYYDTVSVAINAIGTSEPPSATERSGIIVTTSSYLLSGDLVLTHQNDQFILKLAQNFMATSALPGLVVYLTNNPATNSGALEIAPITQFTGSQQFVIQGLNDINDYKYVLFYCKPFAVKVGDSELM